MLNLTLKGRQVIFTKPFNGLTPEEVAVVADAKPERVIFIDTPPMKGLYQAITQLREACSDQVEIVLRDHHDVDGEPTAPRDMEIRAAADGLRAMLGDKATISTRRKNPACSGLIQIGEFAADGNLIIADSDLDGLTASMKAVGLTYPGLDEDAAILDGPRVTQTREQGLSALAELLVKGMSTLPPFNKENPAPSEKAKLALWSSFVAATQGDEKARLSLESNVLRYEAAVMESDRLAANAVEIAPGLIFVDAAKAANFDLTALSQKLEAMPGCKVTVIRKNNGPIAPLHGGIQYSVAVAQSAKGSINLKDIKPAEMESSPKEGIISNFEALLHCNEEKWNSLVLPALSKLS